MEILPTDFFSSEICDIDDALEEFVLELKSSPAAVVVVVVVFFRGDGIFLSFVPSFPVLFNLLGRWIFPFPS